MYMNRIEIIGNVGQDLVIRSCKTRTRNGEKDSNVVTFSVATSKRYKNSDGETVEDVQWHRVVAYPGMSEYVIACHTKKGSSVFCAGEMRYVVYTDKNSGLKKYTTEIRLTEFQMLSGKPKETTCPTCGTQFTPGYDNSATVTNGNQAQAPTADEMDDLPF